MTTRGTARVAIGIEPSRVSIATRRQDVALGLQLAVNGGSASRLRLVLTAVGIGLCTAVLLLAASLGPALDSRAERTEASTPQYLSPSWLPLQDGQDPVSLAIPGSFEVHDSAVPYHGRTVYGWDLATLPQHLDAAPPPPGVDRFPGPGELVVSPALAELLATPEGDDLLTRLTGRVIGTIAPANLLGPDELRFYRGAEPSTAEPTRSTVATGWGLAVQAPPDASDEFLPAMLLAGTTVVIVPLLIFVGLMSRLGGPARDRRAAAIRLLGASAEQLRRLTLVESGLAAVGGLLLGGLGFLLARQAGPLLHIGAAGFFPSDLTPAPLALLAVVAFVPAATVGAALAGGRRVVAEPLGVVRVTTPRRHSPWPGLGLLVVGALAMTGGLYSGVLVGRSDGMMLMSLAIVTLLASVAVLLPWTLQRLATHLPTGGIAWQLAVRRLQVDSSTPAQVVAGICVVLAGAIALQPLITLLGSDRTGAATSGVSGGGVEQLGYRIFVYGPTVAELTSVVNEVAAADGVRKVVGGVPLGGTVGVTAPAVPGQQIDSTGYFSAEVTPCAAIPEVPDCRDGQVFALAPTPAAGFDEETAAQAAITMSRLTAGAAVEIGGFSDTATINLPPLAGLVQRDPARFGGHGDASLLITPGALGGAADSLLAGIFMDLRVIADNPSSTVADQLRTSMADLTWRAGVGTTAEATGSRAEFTSTARTGLVIGAVLTLLVAVVGLLVMTIEQVVDRRRALTLNIAGGVPRGVIARSLMIGMGIPILAGVLLAAAVGTGLSAFLLTLIDETWRPDWALLGLYAAGTVLIVAVTTLAVVPLVARLTRLDAIRTG